MTDSNGCVAVAINPRLILCLHFKKESGEGQDNAHPDSVDLMTPNEKNSWFPIDQKYLNIRFFKNIILFTYFYSKFTLHVLIFVFFSYINILFHKNKAFLSVREDETGKDNYNEIRNFNQLSKV